MLHSRALRKFVLHENEGCFGEFFTWYGFDMRFIHRRSFVTFTLALVLASCAGPSGVTTGNNANKKPPTAKGAPLTSAGSTAPGQALLRTIPQSVDVVQLTGKAKIISDQGGSLISDQGGSLISNNGGGIISNNTGNLLGKAKWRLQQARAGEFLLADAVVTVQDAAGRQLVDQSGKPLQGVTDQAGNFIFKATLPDENLVLAIKLWNGGQLMAIVARQAAKERTLDLDTASTLGTSYILQQYVRGDQATFDKLPANEAERLQRELGSAVPLLSETPSYQVQNSVALTEALRAKSPSLNTTLKDIEVLLLGGLGDGRLASEVPLNRPRVLWVNSAGELYIGEDDFGRIRRVAQDGSVTTYADARGGIISENFPKLSSVAAGENGTFYVVSQARRRVFLVEPGQAPRAVVGNGELESETFVEGPAAQTGCLPYAVAYDAARKHLWVAQRGTGQDGRSFPNRLFKVDAQGALRLVPLPTGNEKQAISSLAVAPDGGLYLLQGRSLYHLPLDGAWAEEAKDLEVNAGNVTLTADGGLLIAEDRGARVLRRTPGGTLAAIPGPVDPELALREPVYAAMASDGTLYVADYARNQVLAQTPDGRWSRKAGASNVVQVGQSEFTFNSPAGIAFDDQNRLIVSESSGHAIKRLEGTRLAVMAGGQLGFTGDGGPADKATLNFPGGLTFHQGQLYLVDVSNGAIRAIDAQGVITTRVGGQNLPPMEPLQPEARVAARSVKLDRAGQVAVGPDGSIYWTAFRQHQIFRCTPEGEIRLLAGAPQTPGVAPIESPDGPAASSALAAPLGLAFKPGEPDNLYFSEVANCRIRRVVGITGPSPTVETVAGAGRIATLLKVAQPPGWETQDTGIAALEATLILPSAVAFDAQGTMYIAEGGSGNLSDFGGSLEFLAGLNLQKTAARIRTLDATGIIRTLVGPGGKLYPDPNDANGIGLPTAMAFDSTGRLAVVDTRNNSVRIIPAEALRH